MKVISPTLHGIIDYGAVLFLILAPSLFNLTGTPATTLYVLAALVAGLTLLTAFPPGLLKVIPVPTHGVIDLITSITIAVLPWILGFAERETARNLFLAIAVLVFVVWLLTDWRARADRTH